MTKDVRVTFDIGHWAFDLGEGIGYKGIWYKGCKGKGISVWGIRPVGFGNSELPLNDR